MILRKKNPTTVKANKVAKFNSIIHVQLSAYCIDIISCKKILLTVKTNKLAKFNSITHVQLFTYCIDIISCKEFPPMMCQAQI